MMRTVFHDGLMSFWLWFLPNSAHSDGPWLPDWKRYIWEECSLLNTSCGCYVSRSFVMVEPSMMRNSFHDGLMSFWLWFLPNSAHSDGPWLPDWKGYIWEECSLSNTSCGCYVSRTSHSHGWALRDENSFHDGLMSFWLWFLPNSAHSDGPWLCDWKRYIWEKCSLSNTSCGCYVSRTFSWLSPPWWEQFSRRSYELLALILTKLSSLWRAMATWLKAIYLGGV